MAAGTLPRRAMITLPLIVTAMQCSMLQPTTLTMLNITVQQQSHPLFSMLKTQTLNGGDQAAANAGKLPVLPMFQATAILQH